MKKDINTAALIDFVTTYVGCNVLAATKYIQMRGFKSFADVLAAAGSPDPREFVRKDFWAE